LVGFDVSQQQVNLIRRFNSNAQTPDSTITRLHWRGQDRNGRSDYCHFSKTISNGKH
jgi:hypothetical protein